MKRAAPALAAVASAVLLAGVAHAEALTPRFTRTDNTMSFQYDAETGTMPLATSSMRFKRDQKFAFTGYVRERPGAAVGRRLVGLVSVKLTADRRVAFDGRFRLVVLDSDGNVAHRASRSTRIVLRDAPGRRGETLRFPAFDLESDTYTVFGRFRSR